jgi:hypothetical protein
MPRHLALRLTLGSVFLAITMPAFAGVPSPANSSTPPCLVTCPFGDIPVTVVVRDLANNPIVGSNVVLDFHNCPAAHLCSPGESSHALPYTLDPIARTLSLVTPAGGSVTFAAQVGGTGPAGSVSVFADGVLLHQYALASPDQDGDGTVNLFFGPDGPTFTSKVGTSNPTADFDCSGLVDAADQAIESHHSDHACFGFIDAAGKSTWGRLKQHYR